MTQRTRLFHGQGFRGVQAVAFSPDGSKLVTVCTDNPHTMFVWDWAAGTCLLERRTRPGPPPCVYGVVWSPFDPTMLATFGENHVMFWSLRQDPTYAAKKVRPCRHCMLPDCTHSCVGWAVTDKLSCLTARAHANTTVRSWSEPRWRSCSHMQTSIVGHCTPVRAASTSSCASWRVHRVSTLGHEVSVCVKPNVQKPRVRCTRCMLTLHAVYCSLAFSAIHRHRLQMLPVMALTKCCSIPLTSY
jgi:hypothetical protein